MLSSVPINLREPMLTQKAILKIAVFLAIFLIALSGIFFYYFKIDFLRHLPKIVLCPFRFLTGINCPGCGTVRAMLSLGQFKIRQALALNLFSLPLFLGMVGYLFSLKVPRQFSSRGVLRLLVAVVFIIWLLQLGDIIR
tara:strand:- start:1734 stop:2150 length:417 start_codon:yes stop_codon:yes gene_type:complete